MTGTSSKDQHLADAALMRDAGQDREHEGKSLNARQSVIGNAKQNETIGEPSQEECGNGSADDG